MLTRSGYGAALGALVLAMTGWWWHYEELLVVAVAVFVALLVALWGARVDPHVEIIRTIPTPRVARGDLIQIHYRAENLRRRSTSGAEINDYCSGAGVRIPLPPLAPFERVEVTGAIPTTRRGKFPVGPSSIERVDPLGLAIGSRSQQATNMVMVHPRLHALTGPYGEVHSVAEEAVLRRATSDPLSGFVTLREYVDGDDPRLIHWPTTARMGTMMLREHVELRRPELTVVLDTVATVAQPDDFEEMVDITASIAVHALHSGIVARLHTTHLAHPGERRPLHADNQVLDALTIVTQSTPPESNTIHGALPAHHATNKVVVVTGPDGPSSTVRARNRVSVIRVGQGAMITPGVELAVQDAFEFVRRWRP